MSEKMSFEQANRQLEEVIRKMESRTLSLQESLEYYAKACELLVYCSKELESCKGKLLDINERIEEMKSEGGNANV